MYGSLIKVGSVVATCPSTSSSHGNNRLLAQQGQFSAAGNGIPSLTPLDVAVKLKSLRPRGIVCLSHIWISEELYILVTSGSLRTVRKLANVISSFECTTLIKLPNLLTFFFYRFPLSDFWSSRMHLSISEDASFAILFGTFSYSHLRHFAL